MLRHTAQAIAPLGRSRTHHGLDRGKESEYMGYDRYQYQNLAVPLGSGARKPTGRKLSERRDAQASTPVVPME